jgi:diadenosine tetraphosphatase ApaH/serine/threonine PP2A family protein phosphatase
MRVAVLSDIHSNLVALDAVLAHAGPVDGLWHLGDVVGYGPDPDGVVARLAAAGAVGVLGNHDAAALGGPEIDWFNPEARAAVEWTRDTMAAATRDWLRTLPHRLALGPLTLVHGSPRDPLREYITSLSSARANLLDLETAYGLHGHTHIPIAFVDEAGRIRAFGPADGTTLQLDDRPSLLNPGSVGQPRDGDPRAAYLTLDFEGPGGAAPGATPLVTWHRVAYDVASVQAAIRAAGLPNRLADRLAIGA